MTTHLFGSSVATELSKEMCVEIGGRSVEARVVRGSFVRVFGLTLPERETLAARLSGEFSKNRKPLIVQCTDHGWLEVQDDGAYLSNSYKKQLALTTQLQARIVKIMEELFRAATQD